MTGTELKNSLGLSKLPFVFIQKILGISQPIFVITLDSRRPQAYLSPARVKQTNVVTIQKVIGLGNNFLMGKYAMTPPMLIEDTNPIINSGTTVIRRDVGAEYFLNQQMFESENNIKEIEIIEWK